jgi:cathepsin F
MADPGAKFSHMTPFADWTIEEFTARNTLQAPLFNARDAPVQPLLDTSQLPRNFDWRQKGAVNVVKNQGQCGSCWAFATVANIEGLNFVKTGKLLSLSEQELVDCDNKTGDMGCDGGLPSNAYKDMIQSKLGLETESDYPYTSAFGQINLNCKLAQDKETVFISNWTMISTDEDQIAAALVKYGPLAIGINAGMMQWYWGGIAAPWRIFCNPKRIDHGVVLVGFGVDDRTNTSYWTIRNSWGADWGEKGYYRLIRGTGACGVNTMATTAIMDSTKSTAEFMV